jgi:transcriptional regulator with XRE-family HTH domain
MKTGRKTTTRYPSLRAFVNSHPRTVKQGQIAAKLGLTQPQLSEYLSGRLVPGRATALRLSREYGIDLHGLLDPQRAAS